MADVLLLHHVQGLTDGVRELADRLRAGGHTVHTPDLFEGVVADTLEDGMSLARTLSDDEVDARLADLPTDVVHAGISWGVATAQRHAQTRPGSRGAVLLEACLPISGEWAVGPWPAGLPVQVHGMDQDPFFALEGDLDAAREVVAAAGPGLGEVFTYSGDQHLFTDSSLPSYDADATALVVERVLAFLDRVAG
ncbi:dienelactone hydrolase family protein [Nocardioides sp. SYSU D00038]|uniref:dienelactone hydrolase family protein n=1 Tax=Nocardioides sp. SYSU D00038 TaxID=2812554 RepID=UPI0019671449|nr:dienelactone hydrolase family protein [Nocardioides sp. SYSU D00038]